MQVLVVDHSWQETAHSLSPYVSFSAVRRVGKSFMGWLPNTIGRYKEVVSFVVLTETRIGLWSSHTALACMARPSGVSGTDRDSPRNLHCKDSDCFDELTPDRDQLFWCLSGLPLLRKLLQEEPEWKVSSKISMVKPTPLRLIIGLFSYLPFTLNTPSMPKLSYSISCLLHNYMPILFTWGGWKHW